MSNDIKSLERARVELAKAETTYDQARASAFLRSHDEAVRKFKYPAGKPVPSKVLEMIVESSLEVKEARAAVDRAKSTLVDIKESLLDKDLTTSDEDPDAAALGELDGILIKEFGEPASDVLMSILNQVEVVQGNINHCKDQISETTDDDRAFWEHQLEDMVINGSDMSEHIVNLGLILRRTRTKAAASLVRSVLTMAKDIRKDARDLAEFAKIKIRGW